MKHKNLKFVIAIVLFTLILFLFGFFWVSENIKTAYFDEIDGQYENIKKLVKEDEDTVDYLKKYNIKIYENVTKNLAFLLREGMSDDTFDKEELLELSNNVEIDNIFILDKNLDILVEKNESNFDFKNAKFDSFKNIFNNKTKIERLEINNNEYIDYYCAAKINDDLIIVIFVDGKSFNNEDLLHWEKILLDKKSNNSFLYYVVEKDSNKVVYNYDVSKIGKILNIGKNDISDTEFKPIKIFDDLVFAKKYHLDNVDIIISIYINVVMKKPIIYMLFATLVFLICSIFIAVYSVVVSEEANLIKEGFSDTIDTAKYDKTRKSKIYIITLIAGIVIVLSMLFFGNIYSISLVDESASFLLIKQKI